MVVAVNVVVVKLRSITKTLYWAYPPYSVDKTEIDCKVYCY